MRRLNMLHVLFLGTLAAAGANATVVWDANCSQLDLNNWTRLDCGGVGGSCPCTTTNFGPGRCDPLRSTSTSTHTMPNPIVVQQGVASRLQMVTDPDGFSDVVLRVQLAFNDTFTDGTGNYWTRVELVSDRHAGDFSEYHAGDDFFFGISMYFPSAYFDRWICNADGLNPLLRYSQTDRCLGGTPTTDFFPWNVVTQWHGPGAPSMGFLVQRLPVSGTQQYQMALTSFGNGIRNSNGDLITGVWADAGDPSKGGALWTDHWYHFVVHMHFSAGSDGFMELWESIDSGNFVQQTFNGVGAAPACFNSNPGARCYTSTMDPASPSGVTLKQGLYRNPALRATSGTATTMYYKDMKVATTLTEAEAGLQQCGPGTCPGGCCDSSGACQPGTSNAACGNVGALCIPCSNGNVCTNQTCTAPGCGPSTCPNGCCTLGGGCLTRTTNTYCGGT